jgi:hypothetical protein
MSLWAWFLSLLVWLSVDPEVVSQEPARAAACVASAYASFNQEPAPAPEPTKCVCGGTCKNGIWRPDGRIEQPCSCPSTCDCKNKKGCLSGACPKK